MSLHQRWQTELDKSVQRGEGHCVHHDMLVEIAFHLHSSNAAHYAHELTGAQDG